MSSKRAIQACIMAQKSISPLSLVVTSYNTTDFILICETMNKKSEQRTMAMLRAQVTFTKIFYDEDLLSVHNPRFGCDEGPQQSLDSTLPAPKRGVVGLWHHWAMISQELAEGLAPRDELRFLSIQEKIKFCLVGQITMLQVAANHSSCQVKLYPTKSYRISLQPCFSTHG